MPVSLLASGILGVTKVASGIRRLMMVFSALGFSKAAPLVATITGSTTRGMPGAYSASVSATTRTIAALASMPVLIASAPISERQAMICWRTIASGKA